MNDGTESAGRINWSNLLNSPGGGSPYGGDGFFLPSQDLINAYQTDANGLPDFNYQSKSDYSWAVLNNGVYTLQNTTPNVDPRLDFVVGRPTITWKLIRTSRVRDGCVIRILMAIIARSASGFLRKVVICLMAGLGGLHS